jgi:hypothetical protein
MEGKRKNYDGDVILDTVTDYGEQKNDLLKQRCYA